LVEKRCGERRVEAEALRAPIGATAVAPSLIVNFLKIGVEQTEAVSRVHLRRTASRVPNEN